MKYFIAHINLYVYCATEAQFQLKVFYVVIKVEMYNNY